MKANFLYSSKAKSLVVFAASFVVANSSLAQIYHSRRVAAQNVFHQPYSSVGIVETRLKGEPYRGSAAVVQDSRLLFSCAHLVYEYGRGWASRFAFKRAHNSYYAPSARSYLVARGYRVISGYGRSQDFDLDFAVAYGGATRNFGPPLDIHGFPLEAVASSEAAKLVLGYPADLDHTRWAYTGRYYMYATGPFTRPYADEDVFSGGHHTVDWVTTGSGNSGGPLLVKDESVGSYLLAGILVSGSSYYDRTWWSGAYVLGSEARAVVDDALGRSENGLTAVRGNWNAGWIKNGSTAFARRDFNFTRVPPQILEVSLSMLISTARRGDVEAFVRSPMGRVRVVALRNKEDTSPDISLTHEPITEPFLYTNGRGTWSLFFRDVFPGNPSLFRGAALRVRSRWGI